ncbi:MAG: hypothetical protein U1F34_05620 [Gammaproteobacteria bacterium]
MLTYAITKFVAYAGWCFIGLNLIAPTRATIWTSMKYGAIRWLLGLGFGLMAAMMLGSVARESVTTLYFSVYVPLRVIEWTIMTVLIRGPNHSPRFFPSDVRSWLWVLGGVTISFLTDIASPEGLAGRFCVGRCLC